jgi:lauroyl/myristoyl acyltransferase
MASAEDDDLLGPAIALSAGLYSRFNRRFIVSQFPVLRSHLTKVRAIHRRLLQDGSTISFDGLDKVASLLRGVGHQDVIFAGSQFGPTLVSVAALASMGVKVAGVYWELSESNRRILESRSVHAVDLNGHLNWHSLIARLRELHAGGYVLWLMYDAPGKSRSRYKFLGYDVRNTNLLEIYTRLNSCAVIPTCCRLLSDDEARLQCGPPITDCKNVTQRLLTNLESQIYEDPINYLWWDSSIIFSDPRAMPNGLRCLSDFLEWREELSAKRIETRRRGANFASSVSAGC